MRVRIGPSWLSKSTTLRQETLQIDNGGSRQQVPTLLASPRQIPLIPQSSDASRIIGVVIPSSGHETTKKKISHYFMLAGWQAEEREIFSKKKKEEREASGGGFGDMSRPDTAHTAEEQNMERLLEEPAEPALTWEDPELTAQEKVLHGLHLVEFFAAP